MSSDSVDDRRPSLRTGFTVIALVAVGLAVAVIARTADREPGPEQVVQAYVKATLSDHDDRAAAALTCTRPQVDGMRVWGQDLAARKQRLTGIGVQTAVTGYRQTSDHDTVTATADVEVTAVVDGRPAERLTRTVLFRLEHDTGWKVCTATTT